jgi:hypothetical protein
MKVELCPKNMEYNWDVIGNSLGTCLELDRNTLGLKGGGNPPIPPLPQKTQKKKGKKKKKTF